LAILAGMFLISILIIGIREKKISIIKTVSSSGLFLLITSLISAVVFGATQFIFAFYENYQEMFFGRLYNAHFYFWCFFFVTLFLSVVGYLVFSKKMGQNNIITGVLAVWWIITILTSFFMPGMSYLFLWPFLFSLMSLGWIFFNKTMDETSRVRILIQTAGILPAIIIFTPTLIVMFHFAPNQLFVVTISLVALVLGLLIPPYINLIKTRRHILTLVGFSESLLFFIIDHFT